MDVVYMIVIVVIVNYSLLIYFYGVVYRAERESKTIGIQHEQRNGSACQHTHFF